jgi:predicted TIM-barrel fold metal-dependent hydrolase
MLELIRANPATKFSLMHASFPWCGDILAYLDMFTNVYADVAWLPLLSPTAAEYVINQLIEVGTSERIVWGCDTWTSEESYGARLAMNEVLACFGE